MTADWTPESWRTYEARQQPDYPDRDALAAAERDHSTPTNPRPVTAADYERILRESLA